MSNLTLKSKSASGQCLCGEVKFRVNFPTRWCAHCHCSMCRMAHGAAFVTWVGVLKNQFEFLSEEKYLNWYASSDEASRGYCNRCGTTLLFCSSRWDDEIHVTLANFEQPIDRPPSSHVFYDSHVKWVQLGDDLEQYPETP